MASSNVTAWKPSASDPSRKPEISKLKHLIESQQFTLPLLMELFQRTRGMERVVARGGYGVRGRADRSRAPAARHQPTRRGAASGISFTIC